MKHRWKVLWDIDWTIIGIGFDIVLDGSALFGFQFGPLGAVVVLRRPDYE